MSKPVIFLIADAGGGSATAYYNPCQGAQLTSNVESTSQVKMVSNGVFSRLRVRVSANTAATTTTCRFRINSADGNMNFSVGAGATGVFEDTTNSDQVVAGDLVTIRYDRAPTSVTVFYISCQFHSYGKNLVVVEAENALTFTTASTTNYISFSCDSVSSLTEDAGLRPRIIVPGVSRNLHCTITTNTRSTNTIVRFRKNAADGNQIITVSSGATGRFEDASNTDSVAAGDYVNYSATTGTGAGSFVVRVIGCTLEYDGRSVQMFAQGSQNHSVATRRYTYPCGGSLQASGTENQNSIPFLSTGVVKNLYFYANANAASTTATVSVRKNAADTNTKLTVSAGATGEFNSGSTQDTLALNDLIALSIIKADTGTISYSWFTYEIEYNYEFVPRAMYY